MYVSSLSLTCCGCNTDCFHSVWQSHLLAVHPVGCEAEATGTLQIGSAGLTLRRYWRTERVKAELSPTRLSACKQMMWWSDQSTCDSQLTETQSHTTNTMTMNQLLLFSFFYTFLKFFCYFPIFFKNGATVGWIRESAADQRSAVPLTCSTSRGADRSVHKFQLWHQTAEQFQISFQEAFVFHKVLKSTGKISEPPHCTETFAVTSEEKTQTWYINATDDEPLSACCKQQKHKKLKQSVDSMIRWLAPIRMLPCPCWAELLHDDNKNYRWACDVRYIVCEVINRLKHVTCSFKVKVGPICVLCFSHFIQTLSETADANMPGNNSTCQSTHWA